MSSELFHRARDFYYFISGANTTEASDILTQKIYGQSLGGYLYIQRDHSPFDLNPEEADFYSTSILKAIEHLPKRNPIKSWYRPAHLFFKPGPETHRPLPLSNLLPANSSFKHSSYFQPQCPCLIAKTTETGSLSEIAILIQDLNHSNSLLPLFHAISRAHLLNIPEEFQSITAAQSLLRPQLTNAVLGPYNEHRHFITDTNPAHQDQWHCLRRAHLLSAQGAVFLLSHLMGNQEGLYCFAPFQINNLPLIKASDSHLPETPATLDEISPVSFYLERAEILAAIRGQIDHPALLKRLQTALASYPPNNP